MNLKKTRYILFLSFLLLFACDSSKHLQDLKDYVARLKHAAAKPINNSPNLPLSKPMELQVKTTRSPFDDTTMQNISKENLAHPLQGYPLNMLQFKGIITDSNNSIAYVLTPNNKIYSVKIGDIIGDHYGRIKKIYPDRLEIEETTNNGIISSKRIVTLQLKEAS